MSRTGKLLHAPPEASQTVERISAWLAGRAPGLSGPALCALRVDGLGLRQRAVAEHIPRADGGGASIREGLLSDIEQGHVRLPRGFGRLYLTALLAAWAEREAERRAERAERRAA